MKKRSISLYYHAMLFPGVALLLVFSILPMFGAVMAFQSYSPVLGIFHSRFVGLLNFSRMFNSPEALQAIWNTLIISMIKIVLGIVVPVAFALLINECRSVGLKRATQTIAYMPFFLSWVIVAQMFSHMFQLNGMVNKILQILGMKEPIFFMISNFWFRPIVVSVDIWKNFGFGAVVYIAAITGIDPNLYEAADIDGANRWQKISYITIPGIMSTVVLLSVLSLGNVLNAGFDEIFNLYNPMVFESGDILDTYVYRIGLASNQYSLGTAVGLFKSVISMLLIALSYRLAYKFAGYRIF